MSNLIEMKAWRKPEFKCTPEVPDGADLKATLIFAKIGEPDHDDDVWEAGSIGQQECLVSQWGHSIWKGTTPIGKAKCREEGGYGIAEVEFNPQIQAAVETWSTLKFAPDLVEVSVGFMIPKYSYGEGYIRNIMESDIYEISPVMRGAGTETGVLSVKSTREVKEIQLKEWKERQAAKEQEAINEVFNAWTPEVVKIMSSLKFRKARLAEVNF